MTIEIIIAENRNDRSKKMFRSKTTFGKKCLTDTFDNGSMRNDCSTVEKDNE